MVASDGGGLGEAAGQGRARWRLWWGKGNGLAHAPGETPGPQGEREGLQGSR